jgi:hypothetical protein
MRQAFDGHDYEDTVFCNATPCSLPVRYTRFEGAYCLHLQTCQCKQQADSNDQVPDGGSCQHVQTVDMLFVRNGSYLKSKDGDLKAGCTLLSSVWQSSE